MLTALGFTVREEQCQPPADYSAYIGKVVDQDPLGDPPGSTTLAFGSEVVIYVGVAAGNTCPHPPPP